MTATGRVAGRRLRRIARGRRLRFLTRIRGLAGCGLPATAPLQRPTSPRGYAWRRVRRELPCGMQHRKSVGRRFRPIATGRELRFWTARLVGRRCRRIATGRQLRFWTAAFVGREMRRIAQRRRLRRWIPHRGIVGRRQRRRNVRLVCRFWTAAFVGRRLRRIAMRLRQLRFWILAAVVRQGRGILLGRITLLRREANSSTGGLWLISPRRRRRQRRQDAHAKRCGLALLAGFLAIRRLARPIQALPTALMACALIRGKSGRGGLSAMGRLRRRRWRRGRRKAGIGMLISRLAACDCSASQIRSGNDCQPRTSAATCTGDTPIFDRGFCREVRAEDCGGNTPIFDGGVCRGARPGQGECTGRTPIADGGACRAAVSVEDCAGVNALLLPAGDGSCRPKQQSDCAGLTPILDGGLCRAMQARDCVAPTPFLDLATNQCREAVAADCGGDTPIFDSNTCRAAVAADCDGTGTPDLLNGRCYAACPSGTPVRDSTTRLCRIAEASDCGGGTPVFENNACRAQRQDECTGTTPILDGGRLPEGGDRCRLRDD